MSRITITYEQRFTDADLNSVTDFVEINNSRKLFITGDMRTGKSTFCTDFINRTKDFLFISLDKERENNPGRTRSEVLEKVIRENKNKSYILEHYQLLDENYIGDYKNSNTLGIWKDEADILILLNPEATPDLGSGATQKSNFDKLDGVVIYSNSDTGTHVKKLK